MITTAAPFDVTTPDGMSKVADVRAAFLEDRATDLSGIRPMIARSWVRSAAAGVSSASTESHLERPNIDERTLDAAEPVLQDLDTFAQQIGGYVSITAPNGAMVRPTFLSGPGRYPDGYLLLEDVCGTNGDGTAIEEGRAVWVSPEEHYRDDMQGTWCFNSLVRDPFCSRLRACVGLTLPARMARATRPEETALILEAAVARIISELSARVSVKEQALFSEYLTMARKYSSAAVLAIDGKNNFMNSTAVELLPDSDFPVVASYAYDVLQSRRPATQRVQLHDGREITLETAPVGDGRDPAGVLVIAREMATAHKPAAPRTQCRSHVLPKEGAPGERTDTAAVELQHEVAGLFDGLVGVSSGFRQVLELAEMCVARRRSAHLIGERGTGKHEMAARIAQGWGDRVSIDCEDRESVPTPIVDRVGRAVAEGASVVLRAADVLPTSVANDLVRVLNDLDRPPVVLTMRRPTAATVALADGLGSLEIGVSPLRLRREDIAPLATEFAERLAEKRPSARLLSVLTNADWPGNESQLLAAVSQVVEVARGTELTVDDLPRSFYRRMNTGRLSRLEEAELDELRNALDEAAGNRSLAADMLEIGRSTLYRRLDFYRRRGFSV